MPKIEVIATRLGFDGLTLRQPGTVFSVQEGTKGSWFVPTNKPKGKAAEPDQNLESKTVAELRGVLEARGVKFDNKATKPQLIQLIEESLAAAAEDEDEDLA